MLNYRLGTVNEKHCGLNQFNDLISIGKYVVELL